jgi:hypothetical protein
MRGGSPRLQVIESKYMKLETRGLGFCPRVTAEKKGYKPFSARHALFRPTNWFWRKTLQFPFSWFPLG